MFSKACEYAIRSIVFIAAQNEQGTQRVGIKEISSQLDIPERFTSNILQTLTKRNLIQSIKGPNGGYSLDYSKSLTLWDVMVEVDGDKYYQECVLGLHECSDTQPCPIHNSFSDIRDRQAHMLKSTHIADLAVDLIEGKIHLNRKLRS
ncbi:MAG: Rrf2 family transcriptional regulator [Flavobacteriales bacterium]|jgi:Rrf2 family protein|nr:Rrf2 family transcriptional regulator [Flavobacteriales bacterium]MBT4929798.1 Rrf2 family transcriptional regulator [Flavobacteriales bacterium]MBT5133267.1 Rrf2 family transcriptional regulator [Flavobacteriales bacterium]MBT5977042.1 Rrf2 family transcriptional regulator [Flavobacteriales bacterium]MBT6382089.1 Rrf2 family transcriptional regulator [Flavobacteriales bacterium]